MFAAALDAEIYRFLRNRSAWFWGMLFLPLTAILIGLALDLAVARSVSYAAGQIGPIDHAQRILSLGGNPFAHLFYAIAGASLLAGDYRHESWRLIAFRASRPSLILAKGTTFILFAGFSLLFATFGSFIASIFVQTIHGSSDLFPGSGRLGAWAATFLASLMELGAFGGLLAFLSVVTRSVMGSILPAFLFSAAQALASGYFSPPPEPTWLLLFPTFAGDTARAWANGALEGAQVTSTAIIAYSSLLVWTIGSLGLAATLFSRQDLSRE